RSPAHPTMFPYTTLFRSPACPDSVAFRSYGQLLASASRDGTIKFWDTRTWQEKRVLRDPTGWVTSLAFSPDNRLLAWGSTDATRSEEHTSELQSRVDLVC